MCHMLYRSLKNQIFIINAQQMIRTETATKLFIYTNRKYFKPKNTKFVSQGITKYSVSSMTAAEGITFHQVFQGQEDRFRGITVDSSREPCDASMFTKRLEASLIHWAEKNVRGVWFKVTLEHADWVPVLAKNDFQFHHAKPGYVMMYRWLPNEECNIPPYAHTMIGVGAVVVNDSDEILVVKEKYSLIPHWKLPGGYVEPGEDIGDAAIREVYEETNVRTEFQFLVSLRHTHSGMFKCSDIYFVVGLKPTSEEINKCNREIAACEWMKIEEFLQHPNITDASRFFLGKYLEYKKNRLPIVCTKSIHPLLNKPQCVYSIGSSTDAGYKDRSKIYFITSETVCLIRGRATWFTREGLVEIEIFLNHPHVHETNRFFLRKYLEYMKSKTTVECKKGIHPLLRKPQCVYSIDFSASLTSS